MPTTYLDRERNMSENTNTGSAKKFFDSAVERGEEVIAKTESQVRELGDQLVEAGRTYGEVAIDTYEKSLTAVLDYQTKAAAATRLDFVTAITDAHVGLVRSINTTFTDAARTVIR